MLYWELKREDLIGKVGVETPAMEANSLYITTIIDIIITCHMYPLNHLIRYRHRPFVRLIVSSGTAIVILLEHFLS